MKKLLLAAAVLVLGACSGQHDKPNVEIIQDMMEMPYIKAQEPEGGLGMRLPPENTYPIGFQKYKYAGDVAAAEKNLVNPLAGQMTPEVLSVGQRQFETQCMVCHGQRGHGDGPIAAKMNLKPPSLVSDKVRGWKDGHIYHIIHEGQGLMGPYASHVPASARWQLVNYIRNLQKMDSAQK
jgi:mono/diheme cytochrome c family protein